MLMDIVPPPVGSGLSLVLFFIVKYLEQPSKEMSNFSRLISNGED